MKVFPQRWGPIMCAFVGFLLGALIPAMLANMPPVRDAVNILLGNRVKPEVRPLVDPSVIQYLPPQERPRMYQKVPPPSVDPQGMSVVCGCFGLVGALLGRRAGIRNRRLFRCPKCSGWKIGRGTAKFWSLRFIGRPNKCYDCGHEWKG
jgi:predicted RNA-binding Zn-ribbon protein involved in translation (DUF1610 family)